MQRLWRNGCLQADSSWRLPSEQEGISAFETMRSIRGRLFALPRHLARLQSSCVLLGLPLPEVSPLSATLQELASSLPGNVVVRVRIGPDGQWIHTSPLNERRLGRPLRLATLTPSRRDQSLALAKHTRREQWRIQARDRAVDELLWVRDGAILETHQGNVFGEVEGRLVTPPLDGSILPGVTRACLIEAGLAAGFPIVEDRLPTTHRGPLWVSSTLKGLAPVTHVDGRPHPIGDLGEVLAQVYAKLLDADAPDP